MLPFEFACTRILADVALDALLSLPHVLLFCLPFFFPKQGVSPQRLSVCKTRRFRSTPPCVIPSPNPHWATISATHSPALHCRFCCPLSLCVRMCVCVVPYTACGEFAMVRHYSAQALFFSSVQLSTLILHFFPFSSLRKHMSTLPAVYVMSLCISFYLFIAAFDPAGDPAQCQADHNLADMTDCLLFYCLHCEVFFIRIDWLDDHLT